jgi:hypothetical protein
LIPNNSFHRQTYEHDLKDDSLAMQSKLFSTCINA